MKNDATPTRNVTNPSMRNSQRHPARPATPRIWRSAKARMDVTIVVVDSAVQKKLKYLEEKT